MSSGLVSALVTVFLSGALVASVAAMFASRFRRRPSDIMFACGLGAGMLLSMLLAAHLTW